MNKNKHPGRVLRTDIQLRTAMLDKHNVLAYMGDELIGSGQIERITDESVRIGGEWYVRANCTFTLQPHR